MRPLGLSGELWSLELAASRLSYTIARIANPVVFHLGSSNLPRRVIDSGYELFPRAVTEVYGVNRRFDYHHFSDIINSSDTDSQEAFRYVPPQMKDHVNDNRKAGYC